MQQNIFSKYLQTYIVPLWQPDLSTTKVHPQQSKLNKKFRFWGSAPGLLGLAARSPRTLPCLGLWLRLSDLMATDFSLINLLPLKQNSGYATDWHTENYSR